MQAKNEQLIESIELLKIWEAGTESYDRLVSIAKEIAETHGEAELFAVISENLALLSLFCVQMFNMKEILEIFPNHKDAITKKVLENLHTLYTMNKNPAEKGVFEFYKLISGNSGLLNEFGINEEHILHVEYGNYRFFSLLGNMTKMFPSFTVSICDQLLENKWFIDKDDSLKSLLRFTGEIFIDSPDCINRLLEGYAKLIGHTEAPSVVTHHFYNFCKDTQKLFEVCLSYTGADNGGPSDGIKDNILKSLFSLFDVFLYKIKENKSMVEKLNKVQSEIIKNHPQIKNFAEIRKAAQILGQDGSVSFFAPSSVKNPEVHSEAEATKIACEYFDHAGLI